MIARPVVWDVIRTWIASGPLKAIGASATFFGEFGDPVPTRTSPAPALSDVERQERLRRAIAKASEYGMEILPPPGT
jgi:hypothetical protein